MQFGKSPSDFGFLTSQFNGDVQMFFSTGVTSTATQNWQQWIKPKGVTMVYMLCIGAGGGGGGGRSGASNTTRGGGGGAGGAGVTTLMVPAIFLPNALKISVGAGGAGGDANTAGNSGNSSYISLGTGVGSGLVIPNLILQANPSTGGGAGTTAAAGGLGGGGSAVTIASLGPIGKAGLFSATILATNAGYAGQNGAAGGVHTGAVGASFANAWASISTTPGSGGAGINTPAQAGFAGGNISISGPTAVDYAGGTITPATNLLVGGTAGSAGVPGGNGSPGIKLWRPFLNTGGTGGGSSDNAAGGNGGDGGYGCGGGGGGAGTTGGRGGNGGDGLVVIISW